MNFYNTNSTNLTKFRGRYSFRRLKILMLLAFMSLPLFNWGQTNALPAHYISSDISLIANNNLNKSDAQIITETISQKGAIWLRLFFKDVNLGANSTLTITSKLDGAKQVFNASSIKNWKNTSAYFNGSSVTIELNIAAGDTGVRLSVFEIGVGDPALQIKSQCGSNDDRVDANDAAIGRVMPIGCTGWIITNGKLVTAGHCVSSRAQIIEFNVPKSNPDRSVVHPGPEDQYPIGNFVSPYPNQSSQANDWAVFTASANSQTGQTPIQAQGKSFNVVQSEPGSNITITGFGTDTGIDNQTQQIHTGPLTSTTNTFVRYRTDTTGGNSGSPIIDTATGNAVGVHAYGGCTRSGGSNSGERATIPAFWDAMGLDGGGNPPTDECTGDVSSFPFNESFETNLGQWKQATSGDDINWTRNSGATPSNGTGPSAANDGTTYIYVEASGNGTGYPNKRAILNSPCLNFGSLTAPALTFQYHMVGSAIETLSVEARTNNTGNWVSVFSRSGAQGTDWNAADVDLSAYTGESSVQLRFNAVTGDGGQGWQSDIAIDAVTIQNGTGNPDPSCPVLNFNDFQINAYANQDSSGNNSSIVSGGSGLSLVNNTWKYITLNYNVTANTVLEFDFSSTAEGEIHAVGFDDDNTLTANRYFKVHGTQNYGVTNYDDYTSSTKKYTIPVGNFYTGNMNQLVFINDNDAGSGNTSIFSNVKIYEGSCGQSATAESLTTSLESVTPILGDESENTLVKTRIHPNPAKSRFSIYINDYVKGNINATFYSVLGRKVGQKELKPGINVVSAQSLSLGKGIYLIRIDSKDGVSTKKLILN